jgi:methylmalonyl-CoA/ethylmalonyl-CoA epimerase
MRVRRLSHVGIAVSDLDAAIELYQGVYGLRPGPSWVGETDGIRAASFQVGDVEIELMQPLNESSPVSRFIARRGEGIHHLSFAVDDVGESLSQARAAGLETIDQVPRPGGGGRTRVGFVHPRSTFGVLTELEEDAHD